MEFSLPSLFVVPVGNTLPTAGTSSSALTAGQVGIFTGDSQIAVNATTAAAATTKFIQLFQGTKIPGNPTNKRSDKIVAANVEEFYKITGQPTASAEVWTVDFSQNGAKCNEDISWTVRGFSKYLNTISANGLTRSLTIKTPCCDCGGSPCDTVPSYEIVYAFLAKVVQESNVELGLNLAFSTNAEIEASMTTLNALSAADWGNKLGFGTFYQFTTDISGNDPTTTTSIIITTKTLTAYGTFCNIALNTQEWDRIWMRTWVYKSPATTQDFIVFDRCEQVASTTLNQHSTFAHGLGSEIAQLEYDTQSYQSAFNKHLFQQSQYNQEFISYVDLTKTYDLYYIQAKPKYTNQNYNAALGEDFRVIVAAPQTSTSTATALANGAISATTALVVDTVVGTILVGQKVTGTGIAENTFVAAVSGLNVTLSKAATVADNASLTFTNSLASGIGAILIAYLGQPVDYSAANTPTTPTPLIP